MTREEIKSFIGHSANYKGRLCTITNIHKNKDDDGGAIELSEKAGSFFWIRNRKNVLQLISKLKQS